MLSGADLRSQVMRLLRIMIISGRVSIEEVADQLTLHPRTLLRRLKSQGTTFRALLSATQLEVACQLLRGTRLGVTEVGMALGYAEPAAFTHAFERWTGVPPSQWRLRHGAPSEGSAGRQGAREATAPGL
jgi:AraC-like DNA-binding protein